MRREGHAHDRPAPDHCAGTVGRPRSPDVEEVYRRANAVDARISLSTVYRTLKLLAVKGILARHDFGAGRGRYEEVSSAHHDHLIDVETGV